MQWSANHFDLVIFDWDGTLMDSVQRIVSSMQTAAKMAELAIPSAPAVRDIIGLSLEPAIERLFGRLTSTDYQRLMAAYRVEYVEHNDTPTPLFKGVQTTLQHLHSQGTHLAVATGKMRRGLDRVLLETSLEPLFKTTRCADETASKPSPLMLQEILTELRVPAERTVMIGDSIYDMQMAVAAGVTPVGVSYGVHNAKQLTDAGAKIVTANLAQFFNTEALCH